MKRYLTRRMVTIHALATVAVLVCLAAAQWQWNRAHVVRPSDYRTVDFATASPLRSFLPVGSIAATTTVEGEWVTGWRQTVDRPADGRQLLSSDASAATCPWVIDALRLPDRSVLAVVRGCGHAPAAAGAARVTGVLQPSEDSGLMAFTHGSAAITTQHLVDGLSSTTHDGYLVARPAAPGMTEVTPILDKPVSVPLHWRNVVYVFNWLIFAVIVALMWVRVVRDEAAEQQEAL
jgi:hypothetical protein